MPQKFEAENKGKTLDFGSQTETMSLKYKSWFISQNLNRPHRMGFDVEKFLKLGRKVRKGFMDCGIIYGS